MTEHETRQRYYEMAIEQLKRAAAAEAAPYVSIIRPATPDAPTIIVIMPKAA